MKLAKPIACGAAVLGLVAGGAVASEGDFEVNDILLEPATVSQVYGIDEDGDGVIDSYLYLEESDSLG
jgi:hypothetical protein